MVDIQRYTTDVLVVGGGIAGCFAALEARKEGANVILIDKGYVSCSGQSPHAGTFIYFDPDRHDMKKWLDVIRYAGDYIAHLGFTQLTFEKSKECADELFALGSKFF